MFRRLNFAWVLATLTVLSIAPSALADRDHDRGHDRDRHDRRDWHDRRDYRHDYGHHWGRYYGDRIYDDRDWSLRFHVRPDWNRYYYSPGYGYGDYYNRDYYSTPWYDQGGWHADFRFGD